MKCVKAISNKQHFGDLKIGDCFLVVGVQSPMIKLPKVNQAGKGEVNAFVLLDNRLWHCPDVFSVTPSPPRRTSLLKEI